MLRGARGVCRALRASPLGRFQCKRVPVFHHIAASVAEASTASTSTTADMVPAPPPFKAMLDFRFMKDNVALLEKNCQDRNVTASPQRVADLYDQYLQLKLATDELRNERNANAKEMKVASANKNAPCIVPSHCCSQPRCALPWRHARRYTPDGAA
jgi:seryl-tRNA synthetase